MFARVFFDALLCGNSKKEILLAGSDVIYSQYWKRLATIVLRNQINFKQTLNDFKTISVDNDCVVLWVSYILFDISGKAHKQQTISLI